MREQLIDSILRVGLHAKKHIGEVGLRIDASRLTSCDERVQSGQIGAGGIMTDEEEILSP